MKGQLAMGVIISMAIGVSFALAIIGMGIAVGRGAGGYTSSIINSTALPGRYIDQTMVQVGIHAVGGRQ
ncbi:MAG: hypothetical protein M1448_01275 [Candidatus Marsarchaeota archaeon]|jgi:hypothetical protein|nr:hypothetical protein [Candidatus Marsarchaeota archaeon]